MVSSVACPAPPFTTTCQQTATQIPTNLISPIALQYVKDIFSKLPLNATSTTSGFFPQQNIYNSRQEIVRLDHLARIARPDQFFTSC